MAEIENDKLLRLKGLLHQHLSSQDKLYSGHNPVDVIFDRLQNSSDLKGDLMKIGNFSAADANFLVEQINEIQSRNQRHIDSIHEKIEELLKIP